MEALLWFLLPVAAASGWYAARYARKTPISGGTRNLPSEYIQGLNYLLAEQPDKALEVFVRLVEVDLDTFETHLALGNLFRRRGETDRAIRIHSNLVNRPHIESTYKARAIIELGRDYLKAGLLDRAEALFHEVIPYGLQNREAYQHLRELYEQEKDWRSAIQAAINLQSHTGRSQAGTIAHYYCELSGNAAGEGDLETAVQLARKALSQDPDCARANLMLGDYALLREEFLDAITHYRQTHGQDARLIPLTLDKLLKAYERTQGIEAYLRYLDELYNRTHNLPLLLFLLEHFRRRSDDAKVGALMDSALKQKRVPLRLLREYLTQIARSAGDISSNGVAHALDAHLGEQAEYLCHNCGLETKSMFWQCPGCHGWGTVKPYNDPG